MSIIIKDDILTIELPNSEATINAQHNGIKDRTVNGYYLSNNYDEIYEFLNHLEGNFYVDFLRVYNNISSLIMRIDDENLSGGFKAKLLPQKACLDSLKYLISNGKSLYKISSPTINDQRKYIKFPNDRAIVDFKDLCLGDLTNIIIKKMGIDSFLIYAEDNNKLDEFIKSKQIVEWFK